MLQLVLAWATLRRGSTQDVLRAEAIFKKLAKKKDYRATLGLAQALERKEKGRAAAESDGHATFDEVGGGSGGRSPARHPENRGLSGIRDVRARMTSSS